MSCAGKEVPHFRPGFGARGPSPDFPSLKPRISRHETVLGAEWLRRALESEDGRDRPGDPRVAHRSVDGGGPGIPGVPGTFWGAVPVRRSGGGQVVSRGGGGGG